MINPCLVKKELVSKIGEVIDQLKTIYILNGKTKDIKTDDVDLFVGVEWPPDITKISIQSSGPLGQVSIDLHFDGGKANYGTVMVKGSDSIWAEGVAGQLKSIFKSARLWYYPIVEHWPIRIVFSAILMLLVAWRLSRFFWFIIYQYVSLSEISFFFAIFVASFCLSAYPLNRFLIWIFPHYELEHNIQRKIRKYLATILGILVTWVLTDLLFPALIP